MRRKTRTRMVAALLCGNATFAFAADPPSCILFNAEILTMDDSNQAVQALAITGDRILAVGSDAEIKKLATPQTEMIDVGGRTIIPGLIDTHLHAIRGGQTYLFETYWYDATTLKSAWPAATPFWQNEAKLFH